MNKIPYIILGVLLVGAILSITLPGVNQNEPQQSTQTPTNIPENQQDNQTAPQPTSNEILGEESQIIPNISTATITTNKGEIVIELFPEAAPNTVRNFAEKAQNNFYSNLTFHRVEDWVAQGGDPQGDGTGGGQMPTELNNNPFIRGSVGVARGGNIQISNDSQFFITKTDAPWLDEQYTNFGQVTEGMEVVDNLEIGDNINSIAVE